MQKITVDDYSMLNLPINSYIEQQKIQKLETPDNKKSISDGVK